jgi:hypothetical protein
MVKQMKKKKQRLFEDETDVSLLETPITKTIGESKQKCASNQEVIPKTTRQITKSMAEKKRLLNLSLNQRS